MLIADSVRLIILPKSSKPEKNKKKNHKVSSSMQHLNMCTYLMIQMISLINANRAFASILFCPSATAKISVDCRSNPPVPAVPLFQVLHGAEMINKKNVNKVSSKSNDLFENYTCAQNVDNNQPHKRSTADCFCLPACIECSLLASVRVPESATFATSCIVPSNGGSAGVVGFVGQVSPSLVNQLPRHTLIVACPEENLHEGYPGMAFVSCIHLWFWGLYDPEMFLASKIRNLNRFWMSWPQMKGLNTDQAYRQPVPVRSVPGRCRPFVTRPSKLLPLIRGSVKFVCTKGDPADVRDKLTEVLRRNVHIAPLKFIIPARNTRLGPEKTTFSNLFSFQGFYLPDLLAIYAATEVEIKKSGMVKEFIKLPCKYDAGTTPTKKEDSETKG
ncbi:conserved hypothetical protein [Culex quinquefasciatus]|uniref:Uncharacterized protein n=1 Tax=Culex quinquefasciatus TaxID=7176 RepID=B0WTC1_CULQU|nr:conserved hypothetical protein [Culex quinquefasciatus]|eukprot:XP_001853761.1 conserved hypothetical protein [Culex quinquefasciatus]